MIEPFISICIPTYNKPKSLNKLLDSIDKQTYRNFEVIITDDSNNYSVKDVVELYKLKFNLYYKKNETNVGMTNNWNICVQKANYEWIKIMHDDDWFSENDALHKFALATLETKSSFIFSASLNVYSNKIITERLVKIKKINFETSILSLIYQNIIGHPSTTMYKKDVSIQFDPTLKWVVDIDFYLTYLQKHKGYFYINEPLVSIKNDENQVSNSCYKNPAVEIPEYLQLLTKFNLLNNKVNKFVFYCLWELVRKFKINSSNDVKIYFSSPFNEVCLNEIIGIQKKIPNLFLKQPPLNNKIKEFYFYQRYATYLKNTGS